MKVNNPGDYVEGSVATPGSDLGAFGDRVGQELNSILAQINSDSAVEPYPVNYNETGHPLGNINYGPSYASCN
jgi:hypothetical protein